MITNAGQKVPNLETGFSDIQGLPLSITMASSADVVCVTYNMHGFNQGCHYLKYLCSVSDFVFIQEHWLYPSNLHLMQRISNEFVCFSSSTMSSATDRGIMTGRPFGGVAILVRSGYAKNCHLVQKADRFIVLKYGDILFINVYMPCKSVGDFVDVYCETLACVSQIVSYTPHRAVVFRGDLKFDFNAGGEIFPHISQFMLQLGLSHTQDLFQVSSMYSYRHTSLNAR